MGAAVTDRPKTKSTTKQTKPAQTPAAPRPAPEAPRQSAPRRHPEVPTAPCSARPPLSLGERPTPTAMVPPFPSSPATLPAPSPSPPPYSPEEQADILRRVIYPAMLASALKLDSLVRASGFRLFLDDLMRDAGDPDDPIERMLLEQMTMAHLRAGQLQAEAKEAVALEAIEIRTRGSAALMAECRKTALALVEYRERARALSRRPRTADEGPGTAATPESPARQRAVDPAPHGGPSKRRHPTGKR
jgi:hypothetical protein